MRGLFAGVLSCFLFACGQPPAAKSATAGVAAERDTTSTASTSSNEAVPAEKSVVVVEVPIVEVPAEPSDEDEMAAARPADDDMPSQAVADARRTVAQRQYVSRVMRFLKSGFRCPVGAGVAACVVNVVYSLDGDGNITHAKPKPCGVAAVDAAVRQRVLSKVGQRIPLPPEVWESVVQPRQIEVNFICH